jgi:hypothetical protein
MIEPIFDEVDENKTIGCEVDGTVVIFPPVPTGDEFDDVLDLCSQSFERHPRLKNKIHHFFIPNNETGKHSEWLSAEVAVWITKGDLRSHMQVNEAVTRYADHWDRLVRLGVVNKWIIDLGTIRAFRYFFNVSGSKPLPTKTEVVAEEVAWKKRQEEEYQKIVAKQRSDKKILESFELEQARDARIKNLTQKIAAKLWSYDRIDVGADNPPPEYEDRSQKRRMFRKSNAGLIGLMVDSQLSNEEIEDGMIQNFIDDLQAAGRNEVRPLEDSELRKFFTENEFKQFLASGEYGRLMDDYNQSSMMLAMNGLFVVTFTPSAPLTKTEMDALVAAAEKVVVTS